MMQPITIEGKYGHDRITISQRKRGILISALIDKTGDNFMLKGYKLVKIEEE